MQTQDAVTLCLTAGGRPDLLFRTLSSLLPYNRVHFSKILISNDAGDSATTRVANSFGDDIVVLEHDVRIGHLPTIDELYGLVTTPFIFHCEDDWFFDPVSFVPQALELLESDPTLSAVGVRQSSCYWRHRRDPPTDPITEIQSQASRMSNYFTLNPTLLRRSLWEKVGPYARLRDEGALDKRVGELHLKLGYLRPGIAYHIGGGRHVGATKRPLTQRIARRLRKLFRE